MAYVENSSESVPLPALLVERATALARAEAGLALLHARRITIAAVSALLGTIVACAFAQLAVVLLVAWPLLAARVPFANLLCGLLASLSFSVAGAGVAVTTWLGVARQRRNVAALREPGASRPPAPVERMTETPPSPIGTGNAAARESVPTISLPERISS
jgi:hypothetical protein